LLEDAWTMLKANQEFRIAPANAAKAAGVQRIDDGGNDAGVVDPSDAG
jgi:hypothetical protein